MNILIICPRIDAANSASNLFRAINKYTNHKARLVVGELTYYDPLDIYRNNFNLQEYITLIEQADIIHFNVFDHNCQLLFPNSFVNWNDYLKKKKFIFHSHGGFGGHWTDWQKHPKWWLYQKQLGYSRIFCCSAMETLIYKNAKYMRNIIHLEDYNIKSRDWSRLKLIQTPSSLRYKNTEQFKLECEYFRNTVNIPFDFAVFNGLKHIQIVNIRADWHLLYENSWCGYHGYAGLEAMAQGLGSLVYQEDLVEDKLLEATGSSQNPFIRLPFRIKELDVLNPIGSLGLDKSLYAFAYDMNFTREFCISRREWMEKFWNPKDIVNDYIKEYESL